MNRMKQFGLLLSVVGLCLPSMGQADPTDYFGGTGTTISSNISYFVCPARGGSRAAVSFISAQCDNSAGRLKIYPVLNTYTVTNALAAGLSNVLVSATNGLVLGDAVIIRSVTSDTYQKALVGPTISAAGFVITNDLTSATTSFALVAGDQVYRCGAAPASYSIGTTLTTHNGGGGGIVYSGTSQPLLIEASTLSLSNSTTIALIVGGKFVR